MSQTALQINTPQTGEIASSPAPSAADILSGIVRAGVTSENVSAMKEVVAMMERQEDKNAEKAFAAAFVKLQAAVKTVKALRPVTVNGTVRYMFAPFEDLMDGVAPHLEANGFSISFSTEYSGEGRLIKTIHMMHIGGHTKTNNYAVKIGKPMGGNSEAQMETMASTTAKRGALCDALNIVVEKYQQDSDARNEGSTEKISAAEADDLRRRVRDCKANEADFLKLAGVKTFDDVPQAAFHILDELLARKERKAGA